MDGGWTVTAQSNQTIFAPDGRVYPNPPSRWTSSPEVGALLGLFLIKAMMGDSRGTAAALIAAIVLLPLFAFGRRLHRWFTASESRGPQH